MIMGNNNNSHDNYSKNSISTSPTAISPLEIVDAKTLVSQTQDRMWKTLEGNYLYDSSLKDSVIKNGINPILNKYDYPELYVN
jgi:hypothetical protein